MMPALTDDERALVAENLPLVRFFLRKWRTRADEWDDAEQDATIGLMRAAQLFDPAKGYRFSTFAQWHILSAVQKGRGSLEGVNYRRCVDSQRGGEWSAPLSLDAELPNGMTLMGVVADTADTAPGADGGLLLEAVLDLCQDDKDRRIVLALSEGVGANRAAALAGVSGTTLRNRMNRLRQRAAGLVAA